MALAAGTVFELRPGAGATTGGGAYVTCKYVSAAAVANGGTGYAVNDVITVVGGTHLGVAATLIVTAETGGVIDTVSVVESGAYTTDPTNPVSTTGHTEDATFNLTMTAATDYSVQNAPAVTWIHGAGGAGTLGNYEDDLGGTNATPTVLTSVAGAARFVGAIVGNVINITAGTNELVGRYQIVSVQSGVNATLDRLATDGVGALIEGTAYLGGACAGLNELVGTGTTMVAGNKVWIKGTGAATDTLTAAVTLIDGTLGARIKLEGYTSTRGDLAALSWGDAHASTGFLTIANFPVIATGAANVVTLGSNTTVNCLKFTGSSTSRVLTGGSSKVGIELWRVVVNSTGTNSASRAFGAGNTSTKFVVTDCEFTCTSVATGKCIAWGSANCSMSNSRVSCTNGGGITGGYSMSLRNMLFYDIAETAVINTAADMTLDIQNCTFDTCGTCITTPDAAQASPIVLLRNNQATNCTKFFENLYSATASIPIYSRNNRIRDVGTPYTGVVIGCESVGDITTAQTDAEEYVSVATQDYHLNAASYGKGAGTPPSMDTGCWQRTEGAGGKVRTLPIEGN